MSDEPKIKPGAEPPIDLDLRTRDPNEPLTLEMKRFDIFLIDRAGTGRSRKTVRSHLPTVIRISDRQDSLY